jgi:endonuclease/exonuclease/phosphatase (EEP) superfamily protein YafD
MTRPRTRDLARLALRAANLIPSRSRRPRLVNFTAGEAAVTTGTANASHAEAPDQHTLTVTTFNIQFGLAAGPAAREIALAARFRCPDLILLQEMDPAGSAAIARDLGFHHVYAPAVIHSHHGRQFGQAILSPWPLRDAEIVHLPHAHPLNGQRRIALLATADVAGREVRVGSVHTETALLAASLRAEQVVTALDAFADWDGPAVIGGDFNTVTPANVRDLARLGRSAGFDRLEDYGPTADWTAGGLHLASFTLDHVLTRGLDLHTAPTTRMTLASDHRPLWATFHLPPVAAAAKAV